MVLKKPSDYFKKDIATVNESVQELVKTPELNTFSDAFESFKNNLSKIEVLSEFSDTLDNYRVNIEKVNYLSEKVEDIQTEVQTLLKKEDLDRAMMSQLLVVEQSIRDVQSKVKGINEKNLTEIRLDVSGLTESVNEFLEIEVPRYKKLVVDSELRTNNRYEELEKNVNETLEGIGEFVDDKYQELTENLQGINEESLSSIIGDFKSLDKMVLELKEQEIPKYKSFIVESERKTESKLNEFRDKLDETLESFDGELSNKLEETLESFDGELSNKVNDIKSSVVEIDEKFEKLKKQEIPKYRGFIVETELKTESKLNEFRDKLDETVNSILEKVDLIEGDKTDLVDAVNQKIKEIKNIRNYVVEDLKNSEEYKKQINKKVTDLEVEIVRNESHIKVQNKNLEQIQEDVRSAIQKLDFETLEEKSQELSRKIKYLEEVFEKFNEKEILTENIIAEPPSVDNKDTLTPLDQNFVTLDQLQQHYRLFINRIQQQLATIGGGGETRLEFLDDVDRNSAKQDDYFLKYDASVGKFVGSRVGGEISIRKDNAVVGTAVTSLNFTGLGISSVTASAGIATIDVGGSTRNVSTYTATEGQTTFAATYTVGFVDVFLNGSKLSQTQYIASNGTSVFLTEGASADDIVEIVSYDTLQIVPTIVSNIVVFDEGTLVGASVTSLNFVGSGVSASVIGNDATITVVPSGIAEQSIVYVAKNGNDSNAGTLTEPKLTIKAAVESIVSAGTTDKVVRVAPGTYIENNPIILPDEVTVIGHSLRETTVIPQNDDQDLFYVGNGNYIAEMSFRGSLPGKAVVSFDPTKPRYITQSPYVQNCTNFIPDSIGLRVDGNAALGPIKSMVLDSYTQYNQGGIGASITNQGYAQLVSLFTICNETAVYCGSGGGCDLTNSNSSFGNYGLVADGVSGKKYSGTITTESPALSDTFIVDLSTPILSVSSAEYDNVTGKITITTSSPHNFNVGMGVSITGLGFTCPSGPGIVTYPSGNNGYVFETITVAPGRYVDSYNLIQANRQEIIDDSYAAIQVAYPGFVNPSPDKCKRDIGYIVDAVSLDVRDFTSKNSISATKQYFSYDGSSLITGIIGEIPQTIVGFTSARELMKLAITNNLTNKDLSIVADPLTNSNTDPLSCSNVRSFIDNLVGIITTRLDAGNIVGVNTLPTVSMASTTFSAYVGTSTLPHTYQGGGNVSINVIRPFDGQAIYFNELYNTVKTIEITDGGSGYTSTPIITIDPPSQSWGIRAKAIATIENGSITKIDMLSNGRGYTSVPNVTISAPSSGINTAVGLSVLIPEYYTINKSTDISNGISTITINENVPYSIGVGTDVSFFKQSRILATGHSFEFIGSGTDIANSIPFSGGIPPNDENETDSRNGGLVVYTSTNQSGNFKIGDGVTINQNTSSITGQAYQKSLVSTMTPYILSLGAL